ncbi:MAG: STAS domain-containing protein [Candidatus Rifleibacteriota bacterium]
MSSFNFSVMVVESKQPGLVVKLIGELDQLTVRELKSRLEELEAGKAPRLVFDLAELEFMASAGLSIFAFYHELFQKNCQGQTMKLINVSSGVMRVFKLTRMDEIISVSE